MAGQPVQFGQDHANVLGAARGFHIQQLFYRFAVAQAVRHRRHVIHAIHVRIEHGVGAVLGDFLHSAMEVADHALGAQNLFAVQLQDDAQHAVGGRMLRAHVDDEFVGIEKGFVVVFEFQMGGPVDRCRVGVDQGFGSSVVRSVIARSRSPG